MSSAYDQQIKKLVEHIQTLNQALHERNMQIVHWQQVARATQDERARLARGLMDSVKTRLGQFSGTFQGLRAENKKLRAYVDSQQKLHEAVSRDLQSQLSYALTRIDELAKERAGWRHELQVQRQTAHHYQQQIAEQQQLLTNQQQALTDFRRQAEAAAAFPAVEAKLRTDLQAATERLTALEAESRTLHATLAERGEALGRALAERDAVGAELTAAYEARLKEAAAAAEAARAALESELRAVQEEAVRTETGLRAQLASSQAEATGTDERVAEMTSLLANSEREVAKLFRELHEERGLRKELEIRLEATAKELTNTKRKATRLEKERDTAKGTRITELQKELTAMREAYESLQEELARTVADKTDYMQALEGQKGRLRPLKPPPSAEG